MNMKNILNSKWFWIVAGISFLVSTAYRLGVDENQAWTKEREQDAISKCRKWGGEVLYGNDGRYRDCAINNRID